MKLLIIAILVQALVAFIRIYLYKKLDKQKKESPLELEKESTNEKTKEQKVDITPKENQTDTSKCALHEWGTSSGVLACKKCGFKAGE